MSSREATIYYGYLLKPGAQGIPDTIPAIEAHDNAVAWIVGDKDKEGSGLISIWNPSSSSSDYIFGTVLRRIEDVTNKIYPLSTWLEVSRGQKKEAYRQFRTMPPHVRYYLTTYGKFGTWIHWE